MKAPWHLWVVGAVTLVWNAGGAFDYVMSKVGAEAYLAMLTDPQRAYLEDFPAWVTAFWALGVWGAVLGSVFLLLRTRMAVWAFSLSIIGIIGTGIYGEVLSDPRASELMGMTQFWFSVAILVSLVLMWAYARWMARRGVLR